MTEAKQPHDSDRLTAGEIARTFLIWLDAAGTHHLSAFDPRDDTVEGRAFRPEQRHMIPDWVNAREGQCNLYFTANEVRAEFGGAKPAKTDIAAIRALFVDVDPQKGENLEKERARIAALFEAKTTLEFSAVVDSGNGYQALAVLSEKLPVDADVLKWAEEYSRGLSFPMGGDSTQNIDRLLRLPGTTNIPTPAKAARGSVPRVARIVRQSDRRVTEKEITDKIVPLRRPVSSAGEDEAISAAVLEVEHSEFADVPDYEDLPADLRHRFESDIKRNDRLRQLWTSGEIDHPRPSGSEYRFALAGILKRAGNYTVAEYGALAWVWRFSNLPEKYEREGAARQIGREWGRANGLIDPFDWFEAMTPEKVAKAIEDAERANSTEAPSEPILFAMAARPEGPTRQRSRLSVMSFAEAADTALDESAEPLIDGWLDAGAASTLYGPSNGGKTFVALDMAYSISTGRLWAGRDTKQGGILYVPLEGGGGFRKRIRALRQIHGAVPSNFQIASGGLALCAEAADAGEIIDQALAIEGGCALIIIDTLARSMGGDENSTKDMSEYTRQIDIIRAATCAHVMTIHHTGKDVSKGSRGSNALLGAIDTEILVNAGQIQATKQRDREIEKPIAFALEKVHLGTDRKGRPVTSAVARIGATGQFSPVHFDMSDLPPADRRALDMLQATPGADSTGGVKLKDITEAVPILGETITDNSLRSALKRLAERGLVEKKKARGMWALTTAAAGLIGAEKALKSGQNGLTSRGNWSKGSTTFYVESGQESGQDIFG